METASLFSQQTEGGGLSFAGGLERGGVRARALALKKACIAQHILTQAEYDWLYQFLGNVRSFTLIPLDALGTALSTFGRNHRQKRGPRCRARLGQARGLDRERAGR